jgi:hypothetical protein
LIGDFFLSLVSVFILDSNAGGARARVGGFSDAAHDRISIRRAM